MKELSPGDPPQAGRLSTGMLGERASKVRFRLTLADMWFLLSLIGVGFLSWFHRRKWPLLRLSSGVFIPKNLPTGDALEGLVRRFQQAVDSPLLGRRLAYLYAVLFDPDLILSYIESPWLAEQVEADNLASNTALFLCAAMIEEAIEGQTFGDNPANTWASYLRSKFKAAAWLWPPSPLAWKQYFLKHYMDALFEPTDAKDAL